MVFRRLKIVITISNPPKTKPKSIKRMQRASAAFLVPIWTDVTLGLCRPEIFTTSGDSYYFWKWLSLSESGHLSRGMIDARETVIFFTNHPHGTTTGVVVTKKKRTRKELTLEKPKGRYKESTALSTGGCAVFLFLIVTFITIGFCRVNSARTGNFI